MLAEHHWRELGLRSTEGKATRKPEMKDGEGQTEPEDLESAHGARMKYHAAAAELWRRGAPGSSAQWLIAAAEHDMEVVRSGLGAKELASSALRDLEVDVQSLIVASVISPGGGQLRNEEMQGRMQRIRSSLASLSRASKEDEGGLQRLEALHTIGQAPRERDRDERDYYNDVVATVPASSLTLGVTGRGQFTHEGYIRVERNCYSRIALDHQSQPVRCECEAAGRTSCAEATCQNAAVRRECPPGAHTREWLQANGGTCGNCRLDHGGGKPSVRVLRTRRTGRGAFTDGDIGEGSLVVEYVGEVISVAVKSQRERDGQGGYMMWLDRERGMALDARYLGGVARFLNHRCDGGNCEARTWQDGKGRARIGIYARTAIPKGAELTYDYDDGDVGVGEVKGELGFTCVCGGKGCASRAKGTTAAARAARSEMEDPGGAGAAMAAFAEGLEPKVAEWKEWKKAAAASHLEQWSFEMAEVERQEEMTEAAEQERGADDINGRRGQESGDEGEGYGKDGKEEGERRTADVTAEIVDEEAEGEACVYGWVEGSKREGSRQQYADGEGVVEVEDVAEENEIRGESGMQKMMEEVGGEGKEGGEEDSNESEEGAGKRGEAAQEETWMEGAYSGSNSSGNPAWARMTPQPSQDSGSDGGNEAMEEGECEEGGADRTRFEDGDGEVIMEDVEEEDSIRGVVGMERMMEEVGDYEEQQMRGGEEREEEVGSREEGKGKGWQPDGRPVTREMETQTEEEPRAGADGEGAEQRGRKRPVFSSASNEERDEEDRGRRKSKQKGGERAGDAGGERRQPRKRHWRGWVKQLTAPKWEDGTDILKGPKCDKEMHVNMNWRLREAGLECVGNSTDDLHELLRQEGKMPYAQGTTRAQLRSLTNSIRNHADSTAERKEELQRVTGMSQIAYLRGLEAGAMWDLTVLQHLSKAMEGGVVRLWAPHWTEPLVIQWGEGGNDDEARTVLDLAWVHDDINGALNNLHVIGKMSAPPEPRTPDDEDSEEEEMVMLDEEEEETIEEAEGKARERQEWDRIRGELQDAKTWEWQYRKRPVIAKHLAKLIEQTDMSDVVAEMAGNVMKVTELDADGWDSGVTSFEAQTWLTDKVINATMKLICDVRGYGHGKDPPKVWSRSVEGDEGGSSRVADARVWVADSLFYKRLEQGGDIHALQRWFWGLGSLEKIDRIIIPINIPSHWITVVVHVKDRVVHVEDPLGNAHDDIALRIREWLEWVERRDSRGSREGHEPEAWQYRVQGRVRQTNGVDCGVFCISDMLCAGEGRDAVLSQAGAGRMRQWLAQQWWLSGRMELEVSSFTLHPDAEGSRASVWPKGVLTVMWRPDTARIAHESREWKEREEDGDGGGDDDGGDVPPSLPPQPPSGRRGENEQRGRGKVRQRDPPASSARGGGGEETSRRKRGAAGHQNVGATRI